MESEDKRPETDWDEFPDENPDPAARSEFEALLASTGLPKDPEPGVVVSGIVVQMGDEDIFLDVGAKSEALMARDELVDEEGKLDVKIGDRIEASVVSVKNGIRLSRRLLRSARSRAELADAHQSGIPVEGRVESVRKGGFEIALAGGVRAFCPMSQLDERRVEQPPEWVGRTLDFRILEMDPAGRNVVVSRRRILEELSAQRAEDLKGQLVEGAVLVGRVVSLQGYGAFVDLGGVQGLLHVSEMAHTRVSHPSEVVKVGDELKVMVLRYDSSNGKVSLGMKQLLADPWAAIGDQITIGDRLTGKVSRVAEFGAFVEVLPGIEGLVHVSELGGRKGTDARVLINPGDAIEVKVLELDSARRRMGLARLIEGEPEEMEIEPGTILTGRVDRVEQYGVFVRLGPGQTGLVPNEEMGTKRGADHSREFPEGTEMQVEVLAVEEGGRRIRLSRAAAQLRAETEQMDQYRRREGTGAGFSTLGDAFRRKG